MDKVKKVANILRTKGVVSRLRMAEAEINQYLSPCTISEDNNFLYILRRWNSYTPALRTEDETSLGGGYFLLWHGKGIVIDPGFDFIKNFHRAGFSIGCIDAIILTHSHLDHYSNFEPILTLLFEYNEQRKRDLKQGKTGESVKQKYIHIYASHGSLRKCSGWLDLSHKSKHSLSPINRIYALDSSIGESYLIPDTDIKIRPTYAEHYEIIASGYATGLLIDLLSKDGLLSEATIGFTADTAWTPEVHRQFDRCNLLVMHIGTVNEKELTTLVPYPKHLGAIGTARLLAEERDDCRLYILSEFGEEFKENRRNIVTTIRNASSTPERFLVADIGTKIKLPDIKLMCEFTGCNQEAELRDCYGYYGIAKHFCKEHTPYKSRWGIFE